MLSLTSRPICANEAFEAHENNVVADKFYKVGVDINPFAMKLLDGGLVKAACLPLVDIFIVLSRALPFLSTP